MNNGNKIEWSRGTSGGKRVKLVFCAWIYPRPMGVWAKWWISDMQNRVIDQCLQLHGGYGYMKEYAIAKAYVDARAAPIYGGTNEIMKEIIGRSLGF